MNEEYLWDGSGPPDGEIAALEEELRCYRYVHRRRRLPARAWASAIAAALVIAAAVALMRPVPTAAGWQIAGAKTYVGQVVRTKDQPVTLDSDDVGRVDVAPASEVRITESGPARQRIALRRGTMHALIWAPPQQFVVETPSAHAVDLGCEYTLTVQPDGSGLLQVETGWVAFQHDGVESFIPAGARCRTDRVSGPGIPFFEDAAEPFRSALERYERDGDAAAMRLVLQDARAKDGLSLWHLLSRTHGIERAAVFERYAELIPLPDTVTRGSVLSGDPRTLDAAWNALGLEGTDWWREWKRKW